MLTVAKAPASELPRLNKEVPILRLVMGFGVEQTGTRWNFFRGPLSFFGRGEGRVVRKGRTIPADNPAVPAKNAMPRPGYFGARYFTGPQGSGTNPEPLLSSGKLSRHPSFVHYKS